MIFDLDDSIMIGVNNFLEEANNKMSEEAMFHIINQINNAMPGLCELLTQDTADTWRGIASNSSGWGSKYAKIIRSKFSGDEGTVYLDEMMKDSQSKKPNFMFAMMM